MLSSGLWRVRELAVEATPSVTVFFSEGSP
jgi:hypothetical protein